MDLKVSWAARFTISSRHEVGNSISEEFTRPKSNRHPRTEIGKLFVNVALMSVLVSCGRGEVAPSSGVSSPVTNGPAEVSSTASANSDGTRVEVAAGCPGTLRLAVGRRDRWIDNSSVSGLSDLLVPGTLTAGLVCRYEALDELGASAKLFADHELTIEQARTLAQSLNSIPFTPNTFAGGCILTQTERERITIVAFAIGGPTDVDIWYVDDGSTCDSFSNGVRSGDLSPALGSAKTMLDAIGPPAPIVCVHGTAKAGHCL